jgi:hypothetical protein
LDSSARVIYIYITPLYKITPVSAEKLKKYNLPNTRAVKVYGFGFLKFIYNTSCHSSTVSVGKCSNHTNMSEFIILIRHFVSMARVVHGPRCPWAE